MPEGILADIINWGWQGVLLVLVVSGYSRASRRFAAGARYRLWWATLAAILLMPAVAVWMRAVPAGADARLEIAPMVDLPLHASLAAPVFGVLWAGWTILSLARIGAALVALGRMKRWCVPFPEDREARLAHWISVRGAGRKATLAVSPAVGSAAVLGGFAPLIAVSPALLRHLEDADLDQIVLHEWAHIQRRDDVAQLIQQLIRAVTGWHPAVWWTTRQLQLERELACDECVAHATGSPKRYAACLARLASVVSFQRVTAAIPAALSRSQVTTRIMRLVHQSDRPVARGSLAWVGVGAGLVLTTLGLAPSVPLVGARGPQLAAGLSSPQASGASRREPIAAPHPERAMMAAITTDPPTTSRGPTRTPTLRGPEAFTAGRRPPVRTPASTDNDLIRLPEATSLPGLPGARVSITAPFPRPVPVERAQSTMPWTAAADAGVAIGRGSTKAARATAGFFTRMSKSMAGGI